MRGTEVVLECQRLVKVYQSVTGRVEAVRGVDLSITAGSKTAVVGPSGSGKSSLLRILGGLDTPTAGHVSLAGHDLFELSEGNRAKVRSQLVTHVYQRPSENLLGHLTARQQLSRLASSHSSQRGIGPGDVLDLLGLSPRADHRPSQMSGGEKQRLAFARAVVAGHHLVIADEPTAQLDETSANEVLSAMDLLSKRNVTVLVASHDPRVFETMDQIVTLRDGALASITSRGSELAVIDRAGRLQLPPEVQAHYPGRTARVSFDPETGRMTIDPP